MLEKGGVEKSRIQEEEELGAGGGVRKRKRS